MNQIPTLILVQSQVKVVPLTLTLPIQVVQAILLMTKIVLMKKKKVWTLKKAYKPCEQWTKVHVVHKVRKGYEGYIIIWVSLFTGLTLNGAKLITTVMFNATKFTEVSKHQMCSAFKITCDTTSKDAMARQLADTFLLEDFIKVEGNLNKLERSSIKKLKVF